MDDLGTLIKNGNTIWKLQVITFKISKFVIKRDMYTFVNNAYILLSAKLTEQKTKHCPLYYSSKNQIHLEGQLSSKIDQISAR